MTEIQNTIISIVTCLVVTISAVIAAYVKLRSKFAEMVSARHIVFAVAAGYTGELPKGIDVAYGTFSVRRLHLMAVQRPVIVHGVPLEKARDYDWFILDHSCLKDGRFLVNPSAEELCLLCEDLV